MAEARPAREILRDIHGGMSNAELISKYQLSPDGLRRVFKKFIEAAPLKRAELDDRASARVARKPRSNFALTTESDTERARFGTTQTVLLVASVLSAILLLLGGLGIFRYHKSRVAEMTRIEEQQRASRSQGI